jgi:hypothetical protein
METKMDITLVDHHLYKAQFEFLTEDRTERKIEIHFKSKNNSTAVSDAQRWWDHRHKDSPSYFHTRSVMKMFAIFPQIIDKEGFLPLDQSQPFHIWKREDSTTWVFVDRYVING